MFKLWFVLSLVDFKLFFYVMIASFHGCVTIPHRVNTYLKKVKRLNRPDHVIVRSLQSEPAEVLSTSCKDAERGGSRSSFSKDEMLIG